MSFTDHKITQFAHRVADLPDEPQIPAAELKSRFDACPEELRQSLNAVCDDAARLEARVEGIVVDTFGDTIDKEMLSDELAAELDGKATQSALSAEAAARESADSAEAAARTALAETVAQKCEIYLGTYTGNGGTEFNVELGFQPKMVLTCIGGGSFNSNSTQYGGMFFPGQNETNQPIQVTENGFKVSGYYTNVANTKYLYAAFR